MDSFASVKIFHFFQINNKVLYVWTVKIVQRLIWIWMICILHISKAYMCIPLKLEIVKLNKCPKYSVSSTLLCPAIYCQANYSVHTCFNIPLSTCCNRIIFALHVSFIFLHEIIIRNKNNYLNSQQQQILNMDM